MKINVGDIADHFEKCRYLDTKGKKWILVENRGKQQFSDPYRPLLEKHWSDKWSDIVGLSIFQLSKLIIV